MENISTHSFDPRRSFVYMFPFNVIEWVKRVLLAGVMSVLIGTIYLGVRWQYWNEIFLQKEKEDQDLFMQANVGGNTLELIYLLNVEYKLIHF